MVTYPADYFNRHSRANRYERHVFRAGSVLQSAELNEIQSADADRTARIAGTLYRDGAIISAASLIVDEHNGATIAEAGEVFLRGQVRDVSAATLTLATTGIVTVGIWLLDELITENEAAGLRDPATSLRNYQEPGAARIRVTCTWGISTVTVANAQFYPVYTVVDGQVQSKAPPPQIDPVIQAIAAYDRTSAGGYYISAGLFLTALPDLGTGQQLYTLSAGTARVNGTEVALRTSRRIVYPAVPDLRSVTGEPTVATGGSQRVNVARTPLQAVTQVLVTLQKTVSVVHGNFSGAIDSLPDSPITSIVSVVQGGTTYVATTDFTLTSDSVNWSPAGAEPAPGSTYSVTYRYVATSAITAQDTTGFTISAAAVAGTNITVSYTWRMPRIDRLCLNEGGEHRWVQGIAVAGGTPIRPPVPAGLLAIASVAQLWNGTLPVITSDGVRVVPMNELENLKARVDDLYDLAALQRLLTTTALNEPSSKRGVFVDSFQSNNQRDAGLTQTAVALDGFLTCGLETVVVTTHSLADADTTLAIASHGTTLEQTLRSGTMLVNPYQSFTPLPATVILAPASDFWTDTATVYKDSVERALTTTDSSQAGTVVQDEELSRLDEAAQFLRTIQVGFTAKGFGPGERLTRVIFDAQSVAFGAPLVADSQGQITGSFTIPANVPAGSKAVEFWGYSTSFATATFVGRGVITTRELRQVRTTTQFVAPATAYNWSDYSEPGPTSVPGAITREWIGDQNGRALIEREAGRNYGLGNNPYTIIYSDGAGSGGYYGTDPLAQTFVLDGRAMVSGVDVWFTAKGAGKALVQLREVVNGYPSQEVLATAVLASSAITLNAWQRVTWPPVLLEGDREYAVVVGADDATTAAAIAEIGKFDTVNMRWITEQPYTIGVLLSSSNGSTWTAHQDRDLAFRLLTPAYVATTRSITLAPVALAAVTELVVIGVTERASADTGVSFSITVPGISTPYSVEFGQVISLPSAVTGSITWSINYRGTDTLTPRVLRDFQLVAAKRRDTGTYITRAIPGGTNNRVVVVYEALTPGSSTVTAEVSTNGTSGWTSVPLSSGAAMGDGWVDTRRELTSFTATTVFVRLSLAGAPGSRPKVRNLRVVAFPP